MLKPFSLAMICLTSLTFCSCKHLPKPGVGEVPHDSTAALMHSGSDASNLPAMGSQIGAVAPRAERADFVAPANPTASPTMIQRLSHTEATAPRAEQPITEPIAQQTPNDVPSAQTLAPVVSAVPNQRPPRQAITRVLPQYSPAQYSPASTGSHVAPASGGNAIALAPGEVIVEGGHAFMENPPAGSEFEWRPAGACGCNPQCAPGVDCETGRPYVAGDEYICDGGDIKASVHVMKNFDVRNIDMTDTVAHFDTLSGKRVVEKSNRVCIYAPRFGAVRRIDGVSSEEVYQGIRGINKRLSPLGQDRHALVGSMLQPVQPEGQLGNLAANALLEKEGGLNVENIYAATMGSNPRPAFENFEIIQRGVYLNSDKPRLHEHVEAALTWMTYESVEVMINQRKAQQVEQKSRPQETFVYEIDGKPRLRICKVASTDNAQPGDTVDFTIRFDNVGDEKIGNVTILDSLTTRLEYVPDSQTCTLDAQFFTVENEGESLVLRWEVTQPMKVGEGGIIRFKCKVR